MLQLRTTLRAAVADTPQVEVQIFWIGQGETSLRINADASFEDVIQDFVSPLEKNPAAFTVPVYPQTTPHFQCVADVRPCPAGACPALIHTSEDGGNSFAAYFYEGADHTLSCQTFGMQPGTFQFAGKDWPGVAHWAIPGMRLSFCPRPSGASDTRKIATPCRSDCLPPPLQTHGQLETTPSVGTTTCADQDGVRSSHGTSPGNLLCTGLDPHMRRSLFAGFHPLKLCQQVALLGTLHPATAVALQACPVWLGETPRAVRIYSDGSYCQNTRLASWALCLLVLVDSGWQFAGFACDVLQQPGHKHYLGNNHTSAHIAELAAMAHVALLIGSLPNIPVAVCFDATAAAGIAEGRFWSATLHHFANTVTTLMHLATQHVPQLQWRHVRAHTGDAMNELADTAAKAAVRGVVLNPFDASEVAMLFSSMPPRPLSFGGPLMSIGFRKSPRTGRQKLGYLHPLRSRSSLTPFLPERLILREHNGTSPSLRTIACHCSPLSSETVCLNNFTI